MTSIKVEIERSKINDLVYITNKVRNVCLQTLYNLSFHTDKDFISLANEFLPVDDSEKETIINSFLKEIEKDNTSINSKVENDKEVKTNVDTNKKVVKKKMKIKRKNKLKTKKKIEKETVNKIVQV